MNEPQAVKRAALLAQIRRANGLKVEPRHSVTICNEIKRLIVEDGWVKLLGPQCSDCKLHIVNGTGPLVDGKYCGRCAGRRELEHEEPLAGPLPAA